MDDIDTQISMLQRELLSLKRSERELTRAIYVDGVEGADQQLTQVNEVMHEVSGYLRKLHLARDEIRYLHEQSLSIHGNQRGLESHEVPVIRLENVKHTNKAARALRRANRTFDVVELVVPKRIASEEIGDAMESIAFLISQGRPSWQIYVKVVTTVLWVLVHAVHQVIKGPSKAPKKEG